MNLQNRKTTANRRLAKVAVQCSADNFVVNQSLVLRINICGENRHLRQAPNRCRQAMKKITLKEEKSNER
ncbi:hypothetical protein [Flavobacterium ardleyense]|uniref:hypothetical protein n=1 Tax=Flavobacterium ardleyense TaxID=2038737 RepID=UPI0036D31408